MNDLRNFDVVVEHPKKVPEKFRHKPVDKTQYKTLEAQTLSEHGRRSLPPESNA